MNILLIEPDYKNKYPPLGLMKISTYHKMRGDSVSFIKGIKSDLPLKYYDRIYITTLFTFYFDATVKHIRYYKKYVKYVKDIYVGGILATILEDKLYEETGIKNIITGLLYNSKLLGYDDKICIDSLTPDYSILDEIEYKYPAGDNYFAYTTRGCPNKCKFCAVPLLEPKFRTTNNIKKQIAEIDELFGKKRNLLLLDNNILYSPHLKKIISAIKESGFIKKPNFIRPLEYEIFISRYKKKNIFSYNENTILKSLSALAKRIINKDEFNNYNSVLNEIKNTKNISKALWLKRIELLPILNKYRSKVLIQRYIDFNQGIDARLLDDNKLSILSEIPIRPLRIAFDSWRQNKIYENAVRLSAAHGFADISNYMLYNYQDRPEDLWYRINLNTTLRQELNIDIFSFPMKYTPVTKKDRKYIGKHWNKKYIRAVQSILLVKKGIVSTNKNFVEKAFGSTIEEYFVILMMPEDFIIYRYFFEEIGLTNEWKNSFYSLNENEKKELLEAVKYKSEIAIRRQEVYNTKVRKILEFYLIKYDSLKSNNITTPVEKDDLTQAAKAL